MNFHVLTLFPEMVLNGVNTSITGRAIRNNKISIEAVNIRDYSNNKHNKVDDYTYGGGAGMLMQAEPVYQAYKSVADKIPENHTKRVIYVTPQGEQFTQKKAAKLSKYDDLVFLCGHYEGIDERVLEEVVTDYVSIGDYVLTGGELATMVMIDAVSRLVPGVLHNEVSAETESFHKNLLEYPQYSRPEVWHDKKVPDIILSGNEKEVEKWRLNQSIKRTKERRYDLYEKYKQYEMCLDKLKEDKLNHSDMISLIDTGRAEIVLKAEGEYLLKDIQTNIYFYCSLNDKYTILQLVFDCVSKTANLHEKTLNKIKNIRKELEKIVVHGSKAKKKLEEILSNSNIKNLTYTMEEFEQYVYTQNNRLSIKGMKHPRISGNVVENAQDQLAKIQLKKYGLDICSDIEIFDGENFAKMTITAIINSQKDEKLLPIIWNKTANNVMIKETIKNVNGYKSKENIIVFSLSLAWR